MHSVLYSVTLYQYKMSILLYYHQRTKYTSTKYIQQRSYVNHE